MKPAGLNTYDVIILGGGAAGLMCAMEAGKRGRSVIVLERNKTVGEKIRISGGGRCNFTNLNVSHKNFISGNPHFAKSALAQYTPKDFISLVEQHQIAYHEKTLGQLFCDGSAQQIIDMLLEECKSANIRLETNCDVKSVQKTDKFIVHTSLGEFESTSLVIATGGKSIPKLGATSFGYEMAEQFGVKIVEPRPGLVPLTLSGADLNTYKPLSGVAIDTLARCNGAAFREQLLFTHRGLSGPAILQISSYWKRGTDIELNLLPDEDVEEFVAALRDSGKNLAATLESKFPKRFLEQWLPPAMVTKPTNQLTKAESKRLAERLKSWMLLPNGTEGFEKAEVTVGGVDTDELSSKTMECKNVKGLFFIGEVVDVTGWLGGYNFQWAWSSGYVAGMNA